MAGLKGRSSSKKSVLGGIFKFKSVLEKLQKSLLLGRDKSSSFYGDYEGGDTRCVQKVVKEGHFAVIAEHKEETKRFLMPLSCLNNSTFLRLLEETAEEYGFDQHGALTIPCRPSELEMLLTQQWKEKGRF